MVCITRAPTMAYPPSTLHSASSPPPLSSHSLPPFTSPPSHLSSFFMPSSQHSHSTTPSSRLRSRSPNSLSHALRPQGPTFPKTAVVCGAHTELGKLVVRELLRSADVERVHALASVDPRGDIHIREHEERKLRLVVDSLDYIESILKHAVDQVDVAFCCLGSSKQDHSCLGAYEFRKFNFDIPRRFVTEMFARGVQRIAILSHVGADVRSSNEFLKVKGELVQLVKQMQLEGGRYAPGISLLRVPLLLTNLKDTNGLTGTKISTLNEIKQKVALKFDLGPSQAVHVRDVAKAMVTDALRSADVEEESDLTYRFKRQQVRLTELYGPDIVSLAQETRALQRSVFSQGLAQGAGYSFLENVHGYGSEEENEKHQIMNFSDGGSIVPDGVDFENIKHNRQRFLYGNQGYLTEHEYNSVVPDSRIARIGYDMEGSLHEARDSQGRSNFVHSQRTYNPAFGRRNATESAVDSVQALARHLRRPIDILEGNSSVLHGQPPKRRARPQRPTAPFPQNAQNIHYAQNDVLERESFLRASVGKQEEVFVRHRNNPLGSFVNSSDSLSSPLRADRSAMKGVGGFSTFDVGDDGGSALMFAERAPVDDLPQYTYESDVQVDPYADPYAKEFSQQRSFSSSIASKQDSFEGDFSSASHGITAKRYDDVEQIPGMMERFANLIGKAISATDRPSMQRRYKTRRPASQPEEFLVHRIRGSGDMRALGETSI